MVNGTLIEGGVRLTREQEIALNILIRREGGEHQGMPLFKLEWALETNRGRVVPVCFHHIPCSYHILVWEPPTLALSHFERSLSEDFSRGMYSCVTHFVDDNDTPFAPTIFVVEKMLPILKRAQDTARAALMGQRVIVERNRMKRKEELLSIEKGKEKAYDSYAESILNDAKPAFNGNPMSVSTHSAGVSGSDLTSAAKPDQPESFDFTIRRPRVVHQSS